MYGRRIIRPHGASHSRSRLSRYERASGQGEALSRCSGDEGVGVGQLVIIFHRHCEALFRRSNLVTVYEIASVSPRNDEVFKPAKVYSDQRGHQADEPEA